MLSDTALPVITATLPVVGEHIEEIADRFYRHLFAEHPELLDGTFNRDNQRDGQQQQALAGSVAAFAGFLVQDPSRPPERMLSRISHKHASLGVSPDQYQVVHDHLMWAIVDVLGDAVTDEVAAAWDEVYWLMADSLITHERGLYEAAHLSPETVWQTWRVAERVQETGDVVTFVVEPVDVPDPAPSLPGQYVTVRLTMPDGVRQPRQYSLTRADDGHRRSFAVKRVQAAAATTGEVSTLLHETVRVGDEITMSAPFGDVVLEDSDRPLVLVSAGIGITPMAGMLSHVVSARPHRSVWFLHADDSLATYPLLEQVSTDIARLDDGRMQTWLQDVTGADRLRPHQGTMDLTAVDLPRDGQYHLCGPLPFMQAVRSALIATGVPARDIRYEVFGPDLWLADTDA